MTRKKVPDSVPEKFLTREEVLAANDLPMEVIDVPEWGGKVRIRSLMGDERDKLDERFQRNRGEGNSMAGVRAYLVSLCVVDEASQPLFSPADVLKLGRKSALALSRIFNVASRMNGLTKADAEDLAKNSDAAPSGGSGSSSAE